MIVRTRRTTSTDLPTLAVCLLVGCLPSLQHASASQVRICLDNFTCCHAEIAAAGQICYLTPSDSLYTDTGPASPNIDLVTPGAWQGSHYSTTLHVTRMTQPEKYPLAERGSILGLPLDHTASLAQWLRRPPRERQTRGSIAACARICQGRVRPMTY